MTNTLVIVGAIASLVIVAHALSFPVVGFGAFIALGLAWVSYYRAVAQRKAG